MNLEKVERLIREINAVHEIFSKEYFNQVGAEPLNLKKTINHVPIEYILKYRLYLHESINDYLYRTELEDVNYYYRVKTNESIEYKINRFKEREDKYPVNKWMNDLFGCRIIVDSNLIEEILDSLDDWEDEYGLKNWYLRKKEGYCGIQIYFKNKNNQYFPWELQIWDKLDAEMNIRNHRKYKREFLKDI